MSNRDVRERILDAVLHVVGTDGIPGVSNRRIAAQAGVSLGSITYHFASQSDMLRARAVSFRDRRDDALRALAEEYRDKGLSVEDAAAIAEKVTRDLSFSAERIGAVRDVHTPPGATTNSTKSPSNASPPTTI